MDVLVRHLISKFMKNLRPHINDVKIQLLLDDVVKALTNKNFQISVLNSLVDRDISEKFHQPWNLQTPKIVNAPYFMRNNSIDKFTINPPLTNVFKKKLVTQSQQSLDVNTTCTSCKKNNFNFSLIVDQLTINLTQFKKNSETIKLIDSVSYDIGVSHVSNFVQKRVICNVLRKNIKIDAPTTPNVELVLFDVKPFYSHRKANSGQRKEIKIFKNDPLSVNKILYLN